MVLSWTPKRTITLLNSTDEVNPMSWQLCRIHNEHTGPGQLTMSQKSYSLAYFPVQCILNDTGLCFWCPPLFNCFITPDLSRSFCVMETINFKQVADRQIWHKAQEHSVWWLCQSFWFPRVDVWAIWINIHTYHPNRYLRLYFFIAAHIVQVAQLMLFKSAGQLEQPGQQ